MIYTIVKSEYNKVTDAVKLWGIYSTDSEDKAKEKFKSVIEDFYYDDLIVGCGYDDIEEFDKFYDRYLSNDGKNWYMDGYDYDFSIHIITSEMD